jgi:hypothetical protein
MAVAMLRAAWGQEKESGGANGGVQLPQLHRVSRWVVFWPWGEVRSATSTGAGRSVAGGWSSSLRYTEYGGQTEQSQDASGIR